MWNRKRYSIPLVLQLWDAPPALFDSGNDRNDVMPGGEEADDDIQKSMRSNGISPSPYSLLGELGIFSKCGTHLLFYESVPTPGDAHAISSFCPTRGGRRLNHSMC